MPRTAHLSYANEHDYWRWGLMHPSCSTPFTRSIRWLGAWFPETVFPKEGQRVLYTGIERHFDFENYFMLKRFITGWNGSVTALMTRPLQDNNVPAPTNFEISYVPLNEMPQFAPNSFDLIYSANVVNFFPPTKQALYVQNLEQLLAPGGAVCISALYLAGAKTYPQSQEIDCAFPFPYYLPNVKEMLNALGVANPYNATHFPGFPGFQEEALLQSPDLIIDRMDRLPNVPERNRGLSYVQIGMSFTPNIP